MKNDKAITQKVVDVTAQQEKDKLSDAIKLVDEEISKYEEKLRKLIKTEENDPIMVEGTTITGYDCSIMVDPADVARIILDYDYPVCRVLRREAPTGMWDDLARKFGLDSVGMFDL